MKYLSAKDMNACDAGICIAEKYGLPIIFAYENSDIFYAARLLNYGENCLCFATEQSIRKGFNIYVLSQNFPLESENFKIFEGCFSRVKDCQTINETEIKRLYLIRGELMRNPAMLCSPSKPSLKKLTSEISYL